MSMNTTTLLTSDLAETTGYKQQLIVTAPYR